MRFHLGCFKKNDQILATLSMTDVRTGRKHNWVLARASFRIAGCRLLVLSHGRERVRVHFEGTNPMHESPTPMT